MKNYSRQREAILQVLRSTDTHPTAAWVYTEVRKLIPNISLGTVYRNLGALSEAGDVLNLSFGDGTERFDGNVMPHAHLNCKLCGAIADVELNKGMAEDIEKLTGFSTEYEKHILYGTCRQCSEKI